MERKQRIEITDLIEQAVENAITRRNETLDSEEALSSVSDADAVNISGGLAALPVKSPIIVGKISKPPITIGIIALPIDKISPIA